MSQGNLEFLPQEMLINIFSHLSSSDLLSLSETCRNFNNIISTSSFLTRKLKIFITDHKKKLRWNPKRKYSQIHINSRRVEKFLPIINSIGSNLSSLEIWYSSFELETLRKILIICGNLETLAIHAVDLTSDLINPSESLPQMKLKNFSFLNINPESINVLRLFMDSKIIELSLKGVFAHPHVLKDLLLTQKDLKRFKLMSQNSRFKLFDDNILSDVKFKLQDLRLSINENYVELPFFSNFFATQEDCLEVFETNQSISLNLLKNFKRLKTVILLFTRLSPNISPLLTVEELTISLSQQVSGWAQIFPNIRKLKIVKSFFYKFDVSTELETLEKLEELEIYKDMIPRLKAPTVKKLKLSFISYEASEAIDFENCKNLEELIIVRSNNGEWIGDFLEKFDGKLKLLEINRTNMSEKCLNTIRRNSNKVEKLITVDPINILLN